MAFKVARHGDPCWSVDWFSWLVEAFSGKVLPNSCLFPGSRCISSVLPPLLLDHSRDQECAWELVLVAGGHQWCLSQGAGTNVQFYLSLLWPSALSAQDFQLALRFCAIFGLTSGCYQMSLPLESCWARQESCCKVRSYLICHCCPAGRWNVLPRQPQRWEGPSRGAALGWAATCVLLPVNGFCWPSCACPGLVGLLLCLSEGKVCSGQVSVSK